MQSGFQSTVKPPKKDEDSSLSYFTKLVQSAPFSWALIRANEIKALEGVEFLNPSLDVGCGDGLVAKVLLSKEGKKFDWGIDLSRKEVSKATKIGAYKNCCVANVYNLPFDKNFFKTVFSNSTIEHLKNLDQALSEITRVLKPGGKLIVTVPSPYLSEYLLGNRLLKTLGLPFLGDLYAKFFHLLVRHYNIFDHKSWGRILEKHKLTLVDYRYYHSPAIIQAHELFSYLAIPQHLVRPFVGYWPVFTSLRKRVFMPTLKRYFMKIYNDQVLRNKGGSLLLVAKCSKKFD